jgi:hypothetical protein
MQNEERETQQKKAGLAEGKCKTRKSRRLDIMGFAETMDSQPGVRETRGIVFLVTQYRV